MSLRHPNTSSDHDLADLVHLTRRYIEQELTGHRFVFSDTETKDFFLSYQPQFKRAPEELAPHPISAPSPATTRIQAKTPAPAKRVVHAKKKSPPPQKAASPAKQQKIEIRPNAEGEEFNLEKSEQDLGRDFTDIRNFFIQKIPGTKIVDTIPSDEKAKEACANKRVRPRLLMIVGSEEQKKSPFIQKFLHAIKTHLCPAEVGVYNHRSLEKPDGLLESKVEVIINLDKSADQLPWYGDKVEQSPKEGWAFLGRISVFSIDDASTFSDDQGAKKVLWEELKGRLGS